MDPAVHGMRPRVKTLIFPSADAIHRPDVPDDRPSERPTRPTLPPAEDPSDESIELSVRDFVDETSSASTLRPPPKDRPPPPSWLVPALRIAAAALFLLVAIFALVDSPTVIVQREPRVAWPDRVVLADSLSSAGSELPIAPAHGCIAVAPPRFVAPRAVINAGLDVSSSATSTGFVVALASANDEASAVRLEGTNLRAAEKQLDNDTLNLYISLWLKLRLLGSN